MEKKITENSGETRRPWNQITMTGEEFHDKAQQYFDECESNKKRATKPGLAVFCGISVDTYDRWRANKDGKHTKHSAVIKRAEMIMADRIQQESNTMAIFLSKQPCYGGLTDTGDNNGNQTLNIKVSFGSKRE